jgi:hypothetical protein
VLNAKLGTWLAERDDGALFAVKLGKQETNWSFYVSRQLAERITDETVRRAGDVGGALTRAHEQAGLVEQVVEVHSFRSATLAVMDSVESHSLDVRVIDALSSGLRN